MDKLTVVEVATLVYALFGPESTNQQQIDQKTIDVKIREAGFGLDFNNENVDDTSFGLFNDLLESEIALNGPLSSDRQCELSKIISSRLPDDSQIVAAYREAYNKLTPSQRQNDTPQLVINRIKRVMNTGRKEMRAANKWHNDGLKFFMDKKGYPVKVAGQEKAAPKPPSSTAPKKGVCIVCGWSGHDKTRCNKVNLPGTNSSDLPWHTSKTGMAWKLEGHYCYKTDVSVPDSVLNAETSTSSSSSSSSSSRAATNPPFNRNPNSSKYDFLSSINLSASTTSPDFLTVTVSLKSQASRQAAEVANRTVVYLLQ